MSAPTAEPARPAGAATIVWIAFVLLALSAVVAWLIASRGGPIDGAAQLESAFGVRTIGADYAVSEARAMPGGARLVVLEQLNAPAETPVPPEPDGPPKEDEHVDWTRTAIPASTPAPRRVTFLFPPESSGHEIVAAFFRNVDGQSLSDLGPRGGKVEITSGKLAWRGFDALWVHERVFERGGTFRDGMRADLSLEKRPCVMTAEWTRGEPASKPALERVLEALGSK